MPDAFQLASPLALGTRITERSAGSFGVAGLRDMRVASVLRTQGAVSCCPRVAPLIFSPSHDAPPTKLGRLPGLAALPVAQSLRGEAPATALRNTYRSYQARHIPWMGKLPRNRSTGQIDFLFFGCFAQLAQSPGFDLADPLLGDSQLRPHLLERQGLSAPIQAESADDDFLFAFVEPS